MAKDTAWVSKQSQAQADRVRPKAMPTARSFDFSSSPQAVTNTSVPESASSQPSPSHDLYNTPTKDPPPAANDADFASPARTPSYAPAETTPTVPAPSAGFASPPEKETANLHSATLPGETPSKPAVPMYESPIKQELPNQMPQAGEDAQKKTDAEESTSPAKLEEGGPPARLGGGSAQGGEDEDRGALQEAGKKRVKKKWNSKSDRDDDSWIQRKAGGDDDKAEGGKRETKSVTL